jgi:hypothetical protein
MLSIIRSREVNPEARKYHFTSTRVHATRNTMTSGEGWIWRKPLLMGLQNAAGL